MNKYLLLLVLLFPYTASASICDTSLGQQPSYKEYCEKQSKHISEFDIKLIFVDFEDSKKKNTTVTSLEIDAVFQKFVNDYSHPNLNKEELKNIYFLKLLAKHGDQIGVSDKRKYNSQIKRSVTNINKSTKILDGGGTRKKSRIDRHLKSVKKQVQSYGMEFTLKAIEEEKENIKYHFEQAKNKAYRDALISFDIDSNAKNLEIYLDGKRKGKTPKSISLEPRRYRLLIENEAFRDERVISPLVEKFYFADLTDSSWTKKRLSSIRSDLLLSSQNGMIFKNEVNQKALEVLKQANSFIKSYKDSKFELNQLGPEIEDLQLQAQSQLEGLEEQIDQHITSSVSLSDLEMRLKESKKLQKDLKEDGLKLVKFKNTDSFVAFLDLNDETLSFEYDKDFFYFSKKNLTQKDLKGFKFLIYAKKLSDDIDQSILSQKDLEGSYHYDTIQKYNPQYDKAVEKRDKTYRAYMEDKYEWEQNQETCARQSSTSRAFWCAVLLSPDSSAYDKAQEELERTPRILDEKRYQKYNFVETKVKGTKKVEFEVGIINLKSNKIFTKVFQEEFNKNFKFYTGLRSDDRDKYKYRGDSQGDLEDFFESENKSRVSYLTQDLENQEFDQQSRILDTSLERFVFSLNSSQKGEKISPNTTSNADELFETDDRFDSVVKVLDKINGVFGSGFYVAEDLIVTNAHVVGDKRFINLENYNKKSYTGRVIKKDEEVDLALIKVRKKGTPVMFWNKSKIKAGSAAEAIGHPKGLYYSISRGVVSALRKESLIDFGKEVRLVQIDVPINTGNSGGPLFIGDRVIGVNTMGFDKSTSEGLNFAVYYQEVLDFID